MLFISICVIISIGQALNIFKFFGRLLYVIENEFSTAWIIIILPILMSITLLLG